MKNIESEVIDCILRFRESENNVEYTYLEHLKGMMDFEIIEFSNQILKELTDSRIDDIEKSYFEHGSLSYNLGRKDDLGDGRAMWASDRIKDLKELRGIIKSKIAYYTKDTTDKTDGKRKIKTLLWVGKNPKTQIRKLFDLLKNNNPNFISKDTNFEIFESAFTEQLLTEKLNIEWSLRHGQNINKACLFYLLSKLSKSKLINYVDSENNYKQLDFIFCDLNKEPIRNLKQSKGSMSKKPKYSDKINEIVLEVSRCFTLNEVR